jgi:dihydrofolate reductase
MRKLTVFNHISLDGYFTDANNDMSFAHNTNPDPEWDAFTARNAAGEGMLIFGRITYQMMAAYWPTPAAAAAMPELARRMNELPKLVFTRTLDRAAWKNTRVVRLDMKGEIRKLKAEAGPDMVILGSGSVVSQLAAAHLIDAYQLIVNPVVLGRGRTLFETLPERLKLKRTKTQEFANGNVLICYE